ncbi:MAG: alanine racemase, partial [Desulfobacterales bacterium]
MDDPHIWAEIDLQAIDHNVRELRRITRPTARLMAVVKADAYGHGAVEVARTALAAGADMLAVARIAEGVALRRAGVEAPILVFGPTFPDFLE